MSYIPEVGEQVRITEDNPLYADLKKGKVVKVLETDYDGRFGRYYPRGLDGKDYKGQLLWVTDTTREFGYNYKFYVGVGHVERITPEVETFKEGDYVLYREADTEDYKPYRVGRECINLADGSPCVPLEDFYEGDTLRRHAKLSEVIRLTPATPVPAKAPEVEPETTVFEVGHVYQREGSASLYQHVVAVHENGNALAWTERAGKDEGDISKLLHAPTRDQYTEIKEG